MRCTAAPSAAFAISTAGRTPADPGGSAAVKKRLTARRSLPALSSGPPPVGRGTVGRAGDGTGVHNPAMTYSIVARDPETGELGVAVQSHYFQVGPVVPWGQAGVGAVATQSAVNISFGPAGVELMRLGCSAGQALDAVL